MRRRSHSRDARHRRAAAGEDQPLRTKRSVSRALATSCPTGSLDWAGASGVLLYSPELRYQNYGGGIWERAVRQHRLRYDVQGHVARLLISAIDSRTRGRSMRCFMMRLLPAAMVVGILQFGVAPPGARPRWRGYSPSYRVSDYLGAPGIYGMSYGFASYGMPQTYSVFSAYPGPSYGSNYSTVRHHAGAVRSRLVAAGFVDAGLCLRRFYYYPPSSFSYRTFHVGYNPGVPVNGIAPPPVGVYAPYLGPTFRLRLVMPGTIGRARRRPIQPEDSGKLA